MNGKEKLGFLDMATIIGASAAFIGDVAFLFAIGALIPIIGLVILAVILAAHYLAGLMMAAFVLRRLNSLIPKLALVIGIILPLPILLISLIAAVLLQNELIKTAAMVAVGAVTGGTGAVAMRGASAAAEAGGAAEGAVAAGEAANTTAQAGRGAAAVGEKEAAATGEETAGRNGPNKPRGEEANEKEVAPESLGEEQEPIEKLKDELMGSNPVMPNEKQDEDETEEGQIIPAGPAETKKEGEQKTGENTRTATKEREIYPDTSGKKNKTAGEPNDELSDKISPPQNQKSGRGPDIVVQIDDETGEVDLSKTRTATKAANAGEYDIKKVG